MSSTSTAVTTAIELGDMDAASRSPYAIAPAGQETPLEPSAAPSLHDPDAEREVPGLAPADKGAQAWLFLFGATVIETTVWGLLNAVGVLQNYWMTERFRGHDSTVTLAASLMNGLSFMSVGVFGPLFAAFPRHTKAIQVAGLIVSSIGLVSSAFVNSPTQLIGTLGILYPCAAALYLPAATLVYEWFHVRRGLASGIMFAGTGVGGTVFPFILEALLTRFGYKAAMVSLGLGFFAINAACLVFIRRRIPLAPEMGRAPKLNYRIFTTWAFWCGFVVLLLTSMGNFNPTLWIPAFADNVGVHKPNGVAIVSIMNAASVPGNALIGYLSDHVRTKIMCVAVCTIGAVAVLVAWGFGTSAAPLVLFAIVWGMSALCFVSLWSKIITRICKDDPMLPMLVFSVFAVLRGVGNVTSGPISTRLLQTSAFKGAAGAFGSTNFGAVLIYTAATTFLGGAVGFFFPA